MHTKRCLARAVISAVENFRDNEDFTDGDFQDFVTRGSDVTLDPTRYAQETPYGWAVGYLSDGTATCRCMPERGAFEKAPGEGASEEDVRAWYLKRQEAVDAMIRKGWVGEDAWNHVEGMCDRYACGACLI
jgi:hypothetical protein